MHKCNCVNVKAGTYANQMWVHAPVHMKNENGYCLDRCIAEEVMMLWILGIKTTGCCCGHGYLPPFIGVEFDEIPRMKEMGYQVQFNNCRPTDEDSFVPQGKDHVLSILLKTTEHGKDELQ